MLDYLGRRWSLFIFFLIAGLPLAVIVFIPPVTADGMNLTPLIITLVMIGKMGIGCVFWGVFLYSPEIYPTTLRNIGIGIASVGCRVGNIIAPFAPYVAGQVEWLPNVVFGSMAILGALIMLLLPETKARPLPRTVEEIKSW